MRTSLFALLLAVPAAAQTNGIARLVGPAAPLTGGDVIIKGTIIGNNNGYTIPSSYANSNLGVYSNNRSDFSVPLIWDFPLPSVLNSNDVVSFTAVFPASSLLVRCVPAASVQACAFSIQGPFSSAETRDYRIDLDMSAVDVAVEVSPAERSLWNAPRVADQGKYPAGTYTPGTLFVDFFPGVSLRQAEAILVREGFKIKSTRNSEQAVSLVVLFPPQLSIESAEARLWASGAVGSVFPDEILDIRPSIR